MTWVWAALKIDWACALIWMRCCPSEPTISCCWPAVLCTVAAREVVEPQGALLEGLHVGGGAGEGGLLLGHHLGRVALGGLRQLSLGRPRLGDGPLWTSRAGLLHSRLVPALACGLVGVLVERNLPSGTPSGVAAYASTGRSPGLRCGSRGVPPLCRRGPGCPSPS